MATVDFQRFNPVFQSYTPKVWVLGGTGDPFNYWGFSARPVNGGDGAALNSVVAVTHSDGSSHTEISVTLFSTTGAGGGGLVRLTAIGAHS